MSGRRRAWIHVGLTKTGTTSIQNALALGRQHLLRQGFLFPRAGAPDERSGHHCLAWALRDSPNLATHCSRFRMRAFRAAVTEASDLHLIISSEELSGMAYSYAKMRLLLSLFKNHEIYLVAYVREQADFFNAFWLELVSDLNYQLTASDFARKCLAETRYDYNSWFKICAELFGANLIVRPFDRSFMLNGNVVDDFCSVVGVEKPSGAGAEWQNRSLTAMQVAATLGLLKRLEAKGIAYESLSGASRARVKGIVNRIVHEPDLLTGEAYWGLEPDLVQQVREQYHDANKRFFVDRMGQEFIFSAVDRSRHVTAMAYEDLDSRLRRTLESMLDRALQNFAAVPAA